MTATIRTEGECDDMDAAYFMWASKRIASLSRQVEAFQDKTDTVTISREVYDKFAVVACGIAESTDAIHILDAIEKITPRIAVQFLEAGGK